MHIRFTISFLNILARMTRYHPRQIGLISESSFSIMDQRSATVDSNSLPMLGVFYNSITLRLRQLNIKAASNKQYLKISDCHH